MVGCLPAQLLGCLSPWPPKPASNRLLGLERCLAGEAAAQKDLPPELRARVTAQRVVRTDERTVVLSVLVRGCRGTAESDLPVPARLRITHTRSGSFGNDASSLEREARLIPQIKSSRVAELLDSGSDDSCYWYLTSAPVTPTLRHVLLEKGPRPEPDVVLLGNDMCEALGAIHQYGLAHGCLTSHSIACHLGPHGRPVCYTVDDFGLVPHLASSAAEGGVGTAQTVDVAAVAGIMAEALAGQELPPDFDPRTLPAMQRCVTAIPNIIVHALCSHNRIVTTFDEPVEQQSTHSAPLSFFKEQNLSIGALQDAITKCRSSTFVCHRAIQRVEDATSIIESVSPKEIQTVGVYLLGNSDTCSSAHFDSLRESLENRETAGGKRIKVIADKVADQNADSPWAKRYREKWILGGLMDAVLVVPLVTPGLVEAVARAAEALANPEAVAGIQDGSSGFGIDDGAPALQMPTQTMVEEDERQLLDTPVNLHHGDAGQDHWFRKKRSVSPEQHEQDVNCEEAGDYAIDEAGSSNFASLPSVVTWLNPMQSGLDSRQVDAQERNALPAPTDPKFTSSPSVVTWLRVEMCAVAGLEHQDQGKKATWEHPAGSSSWVQDVRREVEHGRASRQRRLQDSECVLLMSRDRRGALEVEMSVLDKLLLLHLFVDAAINRQRPSHKLSNRMPRVYPVIAQEGGDEFGLRNQVKGLVAVRVTCSPALELFCEKHGVGAMIKPVVEKRTVVDLMQDLFFLQSSCIQNGSEGIQTVVRQILFNVDKAVHEKLEWDRRESEHEVLQISDRRVVRDPESVELAFDDTPEGSSVGSEGASLLAASKTTGVDPMHVLESPTATGRAENAKPRRLQDSPTVLLLSRSPMPSRVSPDLVSPVSGEGDATFPSPSRSAGCDASKRRWACMPSVVTWAEAVKASRVVADLQRTMAAFEEVSLISPLSLTNACWYCQKPGPGKRCGGCDVAKYCDTACQRGDWLSHKLVCWRYGVPSATSLRPPSEHSETKTSSMLHVGRSKAEGNKAGASPLSLSAKPSVVSWLVGPLRSGAAFGLSPAAARGYDTTWSEFAEMEGNAARLRSALVQAEGDGRSGEGSQGSHSAHAAELRRVLSPAPAVSSSGTPDRRMR